MSTTLAIEIAALSLTIISIAGASIWGVATMKQTTVQLRESLATLTNSVDKLADRIDDLERDHARTRERLARLEGAN